MAAIKTEQEDIPDLCHPLLPHIYISLLHEPLATYTTRAVRRAISSFTAGQNTSLYSP